MENNTFNRQEKKYIISKNQYDNILASLTEHMIEDRHSDEMFYQISNIYFDTDDNLVIKKSISKPVFKEKLRLRGYGDLNKESLLYLEMKKKIDGYVNKRRTMISCSEANDLIINHKMPEKKEYHNMQVLREILFYLTKYNVKPALFISYERQAFHAYDNSDLRMTFDRRIITRRHNLDICEGIFGKELLDSDLFVMEIKTNQNIPVWLMELLSKNRIYSTSFSKYGTEFYNYLNELQNYEGGNETCGLNPYLKALR